MSELGPLTQQLEREIAEEVRRHGIRVWLDKDSAYTGFVDGLIERSQRGTFPYPVVAFRGSFVELLFALEAYGSGLDRQPLLIHLPGFNEDSVRSTPVLELYEAGTRLRKALDTLIRETAVGRVGAAEVETFLARKPSFEEADAWLGAAISARPDDLSQLLDEMGPRLLSDALAGEGAALAARIESAEGKAVVLAYLQRLLGIDEAWFRQTGGSLVSAVGAWLLCVEYVHDLRRPPHLEILKRLSGLSSPSLKLCRQLLDELRLRAPEAYIRRADETEGFIAAELKAMTAEDLGQIDTFREEENRVLAGAVDALLAGDWKKAQEWHAAREGDRSFWLKRDQQRRWVWTLVGEAASFGALIDAHPNPFDGAHSLEEAVDRYAQAAHLVDRAHRHFEQRRLALLESRLPHFGALQEVVGMLRRRHRAWVDDLCRAFTGLCRANGFLPADDRQQRTLFDQVVVPLTGSNEKVAVFAIDAFRYEMAAELAEELKSGGTVVDLKARLAELPTITSVGMNVLAPVVQGGRLNVAGELKGFKTGEFTVHAPETRARAMGVRTVGRAAVLMPLAEVGETPTKELKQKLSLHNLVLVHSTEIDDAGEANVGLPTFESTLRQIKAAWHHLQLAGVKHFVFTADHGFLLQDETTTIRKFGTKRDPSRRHVLDEHPRQEVGMVPVSLSSLGYDGISGYLLFRVDTACFDKGVVGANFVHGGNSPQERIIPVLTVTRPRAEGRSLSQYAVEAEAMADVLGLHRIRVRLMFAKQTSGGLGFAVPSKMNLSLRGHEHRDVDAVVRDATGAGALAGGRLMVPVGPEWTEVFFALEGPHEQRVRVEVYHPDQPDSVQSSVVSVWFPVNARRPGTGDLPTVAPDVVALSWSDAIADEGTRRVFLHIEKHGAITEAEVIQMLGSARASRRFALAFDQLRDQLPFRVRTESGDGGKRYVKEGSK